MLSLFVVSLRLGLTSFGGPIAHLGYFHTEYVQRQRWLDERSYADLVALSQFLPGPASSQVGIGIGLIRAGLLGGLVAWLGFTLPSALALGLFASHPLALPGLQVVAVAVVAQAVLAMGRRLTPDPPRVTLAVTAAAATLLWPAAFTQVAVLSTGGLIGWLFYRRRQVDQVASTAVPVSRPIAITALALFAALLVGLPILRQIAPALGPFDSFYRAGSLVFGGGHVVLPLLQQEVQAAGWVTPAEFVAGYGAAQAVPGPLFTFAAYLGTIQGGPLGGAVALVAIFLPAFLLIVGALPYWDLLRRNPHLQGALVGVNAAVVGILLGAFYHPIWTSAIIGPASFSLAALLFVLLEFWKLPPWVVVVLGAAGGLFMLQ